MQTLLIILHVLVALSIIALVLVQQGKGSDVGAAFGSGASNTMFGSSGSTSFLMKVTAVLAALFFVTSVALNYVGAHSKRKANYSILNLPATPLNNRKNVASNRVIPHVFSASANQQRKKHN